MNSWLAPKKMPSDPGPCVKCPDAGCIGIVESVTPYAVKWYCKRHDPHPKKEIVL